MTYVSVHVEKGDQWAQRPHYVQSGPGAPGNCGCLEWTNRCKKLSLWKDPHGILEPDFSVLLHGSFGYRTDYGGAGREDHFCNDKALSEFHR